MAARMTFTETVDAVFAAAGADLNIYEAVRLVADRPDCSLTYNQILLAMKVAPR